MTNAGSDSVKVGADFAEGFRGSGGLAAGGAASRMSPGRHTVKDLVEEAKKRVVFLFICVVGLSYLMSLTSSSVLVNLPAAAFLVLLVRYITYDLEMRRKNALHNKSSSPTAFLTEVRLERTRALKDVSTWRAKVDSPVVEAAIDQLTRHLISEWVTDLWYSRLTTDKDGPEELVGIINGALAEISSRAREINLIDLLTRDVIDLLCRNLELYRTTQSKISRQEADKSMTFEQRDLQLKQVLASENKLHPALFSAKAEHKVLQHLMDGMISLAFRKEDVQCSFFRYAAIELLACAVMRPVLNLANPRFINERIENLVHSFRNRAKKGNIPSPHCLSSQSQVGVISTNDFSMPMDRSNKGLELVQLKRNPSGLASPLPLAKCSNGNIHAFQATDQRNCSPAYSNVSDCRDTYHTKTGEWGQMLDVITRRKTQALAPEHFDNMWAKGRNYKRNELVTVPAKHVDQTSLQGETCHTRTFSSSESNVSGSKTGDIRSDDQGVVHGQKSWLDKKQSSLSFSKSSQGKFWQDQSESEESEAQTDSSYGTEDDENSAVTGLGSPGTKVWDSGNRRASGSRIHHPLELSEGHSKGQNRRGHNSLYVLSKSLSGRKRHKSGRHKLPVWQEVGRKSFLLRDGINVLNAVKDETKGRDSTDESEVERLGRLTSGADASSSAAFASSSEAYSLSVRSSGYSALAESFLKLGCEVLGANIVRSGSKTFAVYSISVTDVNNNNWTIKRRFRHFEDLHKRLKEFTEYNLSLPPKHFLSTSFDLLVVQERCKLLHRYLKNLLELPIVSGSMEVWDFLSVDSQAYNFSNNLFVVEPFSVDLDDKTKENGQSLSREHLHISNVENSSPKKPGNLTNGLNQKERSSTNISAKTAKDKHSHLCDEDSVSELDSQLLKNVARITCENSQRSSHKVTDKEDLEHILPETACDPTIPTEWIPPNLSVPILDLVDVLFQLQDGGWIRRQAFWVAKQVLQLGMGDAFDDWLLEKILLLRKGAVVASAINRLEQILWPDGIFITKHPKRRRPAPVVTPSSNSSHSRDPSATSSLQREASLSKDNGKDNMPIIDEQQEQEAARRAKFAYEIMIENAPPALVGLVGRKEYKRCVEDAYFFLQSAVCLKQLAFEIFELLILSAFPELDDVVKQLHIEKDQFGEPELH